MRIPIFVVAAVLTLAACSSDEAPPALPAVQQCIVQAGGLG